MLTNTENTAGFSFVIPCLNAEDTLRRCLEHLRAQFLPAGEILVIDNGSIDSSREIAAGLADQVLIDDTATIAKLRNIGAESASFPIVVFVDSDCLLDPNWSSRAAKHFQDPEVAMVGAKTHQLPATAGWVAKTWKVHLDRSDLDGEPEWIVTRALAVRKTVFEEVAGFNEDLVTCEDVALGHAIGKNHKIVSDSSLAPLHLKDTDSLSQLFRKELWRGRDSIGTSLRYLKTNQGNFIGKEGLSLLLPFYYCFFTLLFAATIAWSALTGFCGVFWISSIALLTPLLLLSFDTCRRTRHSQTKLWQVFPQLAVVYAVYIAARVAALVRNK